MLTIYIAGKQFQGTIEKEIRDHKEVWHVEEHTIGRLFASAYYEIRLSLDQWDYYLSLYQRVKNAKGLVTSDGIAVMDYQHVECLMAFNEQRLKDEFHKPAPRRTRKK